MLKNLDDAINNASRDSDTLRQAVERLTQQGIVQSSLDNILAISQHFENNPDTYQGDQSGTVLAIKQACLLRIVKAENEGERSDSTAFNRDELKRWCQESENSRRRASGAEFSDDTSSFMSGILPRSVVSGIEAKTQIAMSLSPRDVSAFRTLISHGFLSEKFTDVGLPSGMKMMINKEGANELLELVQSQGSYTSTQSDATR